MSKTALVLNLNSAIKEIDSCRSNVIAGCKLKNGSIYFIVVKTRSDAKQFFGKHKSRLKKLSQSDITQIAQRMTAKFNCFA